MHAQNDTVLQRASVMIQKSFLSEEDKKLCIERAKFLSPDILEIFVMLYERDPQELAFFVQNLKQKLLLLRGGDKDAFVREEKSQLEKFL